jgi:hypothetical protein
MSTGAGRFQPGDRVHVRFAEPPGHIRTPHYIRGKTGVIERYYGDFPNPEELAYGKDGLPRRPLYLVGFRQGDVWQSYPAPADKVYLDLYEHWLEPA